MVTGLERLTAMYERMLNIIKMHREMRAMKLPDQMLEQMEKHISKTLKDEIEAAAKELEAGHLKLIEQTRRQELKTELRNCLRELAARFDQGYTFDVRGSKPDDGEIEGDPDPQTSQGQRRIVAEKRERLKYFRAENEPVLKLPENKPDRE
jgi:hypothetical protein